MSMQDDISPTVRSRRRRERHGAWVVLLALALTLLGVATASYLSGRFVPGPTKVKTPSPTTEAPERSMACDGRRAAKRRPDLIRSARVKLTSDAAPLGPTTEAR